MMTSRIVDNSAHALFFLGKLFLRFCGVKVHRVHVSQSSPAQLLVDRQARPKRD